MRKGKKNHELRVHFLGTGESPILCRSRQGMYAILKRTDSIKEVTCLRCLDRFRIDWERLKEIKERGLYGSG